MNQVICQYAHQCRLAEKCHHGKSHTPVQIAECCDGEFIMCHMDGLPCPEGPECWVTCVDVPTLPGVLNE